jgi:DNA-binding NarL/FixJ family response regulator
MTVLVTELSTVDLSLLMTLADLTPRQREVAILVAQGLTRREIASRLSASGNHVVTIRTVDAHLHAIASRLPADDLPATRRVRKWVRGQI